MGKSKVAYSHYGNCAWKKIRKICLSSVSRKTDIREYIKLKQHCNMLQTSFPYQEQRHVARIPSAAEFASQMVPAH